eukprot:SM001461S01319  [mRNA]  locus=s1461:783:1902:- [translate_table: standard]
MPSPSSVPTKHCAVLRSGRASREALRVLLPPWLAAGLGRGVAAGCSPQPDSAINGSHKLVMDLCRMQPRLLFLGAHATVCQIMYFGGLPPWAEALSASIHSSASSYSSGGDERSWVGAEDNVPLPCTLLTRAPLFDQLTVNSYRPSEGIKAHVDLARFEDGIAIVSLLSDCVMRFKPTAVHIAAPAPLDVASISTRPNSSERTDRNRPCISNGEAAISLQEAGGAAEPILVLLRPGDLLLLSGAARRDWMHGIDRAPGRQ